MDTKRTFHRSRHCKYCTQHGKSLEEAINSLTAITPPPPVAWILYLYPIKGNREVGEGLGGRG